jgi:hypothetical protein
MDQRGWSIPSIPAASAIGSAYLLFFIHAATDTDGFLILDNVNLMFHEGGHFLLGFLGLIGGTIGEMVFPWATFWTFFSRRELVGTSFGAFWIGEDLRYVGWYMGDAQAMALPLLGAGDHDWNILLTDWGMLDKATALGSALRGIGWLLMLGAALTVVLVPVVRRYRA